VAKGEAQPGRRDESGDKQLRREELLARVDHPGQVGVDEAGRQALLPAQPA
jgi:hypothetical protein